MRWWCWPVGIRCSGVGRPDRAVRSQTVRIHPAVSSVSLARGADGLGGRELRRRPAAHRSRPGSPLPVPGAAVGDLVPRSGNPGRGGRHARRAGFGEARSRCWPPRLAQRSRWDGTWPTDLPALNVVCVTCRPDRLSSLVDAPGWPTTHTSTTGSSPSGRAGVGPCASDARYRTAALGCRRRRRLDRHRVGARPSQLPDGRRRADLARASGSRQRRPARRSRSRGGRGRAPGRAARPAGPGRGVRRWRASRSR